MRDLTATEAARRFSEVLDSVEHRHESFRVLRGGRAIARITPLTGPNGRSVIDFLTTHPVDPALAGDIRSVRSLLKTGDRNWPG